MSKHQYSKPLVQQSKYFYLWPALVALALSFIIYSNGISGDYVFDDTVVIQNRPELRSLSNIPSLFVAPYHQNMPQSSLYRPLTMISYTLNRTIFGANTYSFHIVNILLAAANALLVFWFIYFFFESYTAAAIGALIFLVHPIHTEAVTSIVGRAELLAFFWSMLAVYFWTCRSRLLTALMVLCALMSKETAIVIIPIIGYIEWRYYGLSLGQSIKKILFLLAPLFVYLSLRLIVLKHFFFSSVVQYVENPLRFSSLSVRLLTALKVLVLYISKLLWPLHLSADYSFDTIPLVHSLGSWQSLLGLVILGFLMWLLLSRRVPKALAFGGMFFLLPYLLISNILFTIGTMMAERLMYFPSLGFAISIGWLGQMTASRWPRLRYVILGIIGLIIVAFSYLTIIRNSDWHDNERLFEATVNTEPQSVLAHSALAAAYLADHRYEASRRQLQAAQAIYPDYAHSVNLLGILAVHDGNDALAEQLFKRAIQISPYHINAYRNLAQFYFNRMRYAEAADNLLKIIEINPNADIARDYALLEIQINQPQQAIDTIIKYFGVKPVYPELDFALGAAYFKLGNSDQALQYLQVAKQSGYSDPQLDAMLQALTNSKK